MLVGISTREGVCSKQTKSSLSKTSRKKWLVLSKKSEHIFGCLRFQIDPFSSSIEQLDFHFRATHIRNSTTYCFLINFCCKARLHFFFLRSEKINCIFYASRVSHFLSQLAFRRCIDTYLQLVKKMDLLAVVQFSFHMINKRRLASEGCLLHISMRVNASRGGATFLGKGVNYLIKGPLLAYIAKNSVKCTTYLFELGRHGRAPFATPLNASRMGPSLAAPKLFEYYWKGAGTFRNEFFCIDWLEIGSDKA